MNRLVIAALLLALSPQIGQAREVDPGRFDCGEPELNPGCRLPNRLTPAEQFAREVGEWVAEQRQVTSRLIEGLRCERWGVSQYVISMGDHSRLIQFADLKKAHLAQDQVFDLLDTVVRMGVFDYDRAEALRRQIQHYRIGADILKAIGFASPIVLGRLSSQLQVLGRTPYLFVASAITLGVGYGGFRTYRILDDEIIELEQELAAVEGREYEPDIPDELQDDDEGGHYEPAPVVGDMTVDEGDDGSMTVMIPTTGGQAGGSCQTSTSHICNIHDCHLKVTTTCRR